MSSGTGVDVSEELFVLPPDVGLVALAELSPRLRATLGNIVGGDDQVAVSRPGFRVPTRLITPEFAALLREFHRPTRIVDAVVRFSGASSRDPRQTLDESFDALAVFIESRVLVPAGSVHAEAVVATLSPGQAVCQFEVERLVAALDDTEVYAARDGSGQRVALKIARADAPAVTEPTLAHEARVLSHLGGRISPLLVASGHHGGRPFLATEWRPGVSVSVAAHAARAAGSGGRRWLSTLAVNVLYAYASLHARGVIHGDIHPGNIVVDDGGGVTVLDYGRARIVSPAMTPQDDAAAPGQSATTALTRAGVAYFYEPELARALQAGSPMPPVTFQGEQYSLAALVYFLLTGVHYVQLSAEHDVLLSQVVHQRPLPFVAHGLEPWPSVEAVLAKAMAKEPAHRFLGIAPLADAFADATCAKSPAMTPPGPAEAALRLVDRFTLEADRVGARAPQAAGAPVHPPSAVDLAWFAYRVALARECPHWLASADIWACESQAGGEGSWAAEAVAAAIHRARGDGAARARAVQSFLSACQGTGDGFDLLGGRSGALAAAADLVEGVGESPADRAPLVDWVRHTVAGMWQTIDRWGPVGSCVELPHLGMAHGWAGVIYATVRACRAAAVALPAGLADRVEQLAALAQPVGRGLGWAGTVGQPGAATTPSWAPGWCSGSAGHALLWGLLHQESGDDRFLGLAEAAGLYAIDHPARNPDLCCGLTGRAFALLSLYQLTGTTTWLTEARRLASSAASRWRGEPDPFSLRKGPLGNALLLVELEAPERATLPVFGPVSSADAPPRGGEP